MQREPSQNRPLDESHSNGWLEHAMPFDFLGSI